MSRKVKRLPVVEVHWEDAHGGGVAWEKGIDNISLELEKVRTVGFLAKETDDAVLVILSMTTRGHTDAYILIPRANITSFDKLEEK